MTVRQHLDEASPVFQTYAKRSFAPLWFERRTLTPAAVALIEELRTAERRGLPNETVSVAPLPAFADEEIARLDVALTEQAARLVLRLHSGRVDPATLGFSIDAQRPSLDLTSTLPVLAQARTARALAAALDGLEPQWRRFALLKDALARYRRLAAGQGSERILKPTRWNLRSGDDYAGAPALRRFLVQSGDLPAAAAPDRDDLVIDPDLAAALVRFQRRHGLQADGVLGSRTYRALAVPLASRVRQIELTIERFRWLPPRLDSAPIVVNIPEFKLFAFLTPEDREGLIMPMDVIVGRTATPVLTADLKYVVFNPYWDVPRSILVQELLPQIRTHADWLRRNDFEVTGDGISQGVTQNVTPQVIAALESGRAWLRQRPGPRNALGRVKFVFPNRHSVYMHDTPETALFAASARAFSHGCIRLADAPALANYVLRETPGWDSERISAALTGPANVRVDLAHPIRVFIIYATVMVAEDGTAYFFEDIYGHDARLDHALRAAP